ncbi:MAG: LPD38 domain-containing protein, partial [Patescibacteria group bacterium]
GKVTKWAVPEELNWAMHQMNEAEAGLIGKFMRFTSGAFRKGATTLYIPFSLSNSIRDVQMAVMTSKYGFNAADWLKGFGNGLKAAFGWDSKLYEDFMKNAGGFGGFIQNARSISGAKEALFAPTWWRRTKAVINPFNLISNFAEATELAPRLGVYSKGIKKGATAFEAAFEARNATIDFAKSGQEMRIINMWIPFVNARWQALLNTARVFKERPVRSAAKAGALIVAPGVTTYLWNTMNYPDLYDDIPQWAKDTYFTIIVGEDVDKDGNRVPKVVQIPKGDVGQIFYNPIEYALEYVRKGEPQNFAKLGLEWMSQLAPIPFTRDGELSVSQVLSGGLPPILRTPIELATNQSFFSGYRIVPQNLEKVAPTEQYDEKTPAMAVTIGRALGISPMKLAYGLSGLLGGFGKEAIDPAKILEMTTTRFYRTSGGAKRNEAWDVKYEVEVGYATARQQATRAIEAGDDRTAYKIMDSWNAAAEKIVPEITPYLAKDDPLEAESIRKSVTFQPTDMARLQRSVTEKALSKAEEEKKIEKGLTQDELKNIRTGGQNQSLTMGQSTNPQPASQQLDLKSMRQAVRR